MHIVQTDWKGFESCRQRVSQRVAFKNIQRKECSNSIIKIESFRYATEFYSHESYIVIGCFGGLGRSLAKWMLERGARKFVFLDVPALTKSLLVDSFRI
jgi:KR domain